MDMPLVVLPLFCLSLLLSGCSTHNDPSKANQAPTPTETPAFSEAAGTYTSAQIVSITDATAGTTIYYTTNGTAPAASLTQYTAPITVSSTGTLMAAALAPEFTLSAVAPGSYTITSPLPRNRDGIVRHGQVPVVGAHVYLLAADTTGYGDASVSLPEPALTGTSDCLGAYVTIAADGSFAIEAHSTRAANTQVYVYTLGGNAVSGNNPCSCLLAVLGSCSSSGSLSTFPPMIVVNEVSTIAAAYTMSGFATDATHVSSSGTPLAQTGIANAFVNAANLAKISTGAALTTTPAGNGNVPQSEINTLADILATCVGATNASECSSLFEDSTADWTASGAQPTDTATAAINLTHHPAVNVAALYALSATSSVFTPVLTTQPNDFTVALNFTVPGEAAYFISPFGAHPITVDGDGSVWITNPNPNSVFKFSPSGAMLSPAVGYTGGDSPTSIAIDESGNARITDFDAVTELSKTCVALSPSNGFVPGNMTLGSTIAIDAAGNAWLPYGDGVASLSSSGRITTSTTNSPGAGMRIGGIAVDENGDLWNALPNPTTNGANGLIIFSEFSSSGAAINPPTAGQYSCGVVVGSDQLPEGVAIDAMGNIWITTAAGIQKETNSPIPTCSGTGGGFRTAPEGQGGDIAIDGDGDVWVVSEGQIGNRLSEFSNAGAPISPSTGYRSPVGVPDNIALYGSGNLWVAGASEIVNTGASSKNLFESIGVSATVVVPIAAGVKKDSRQPALKAGRLQNNQGEETLLCNRN
jgi:hypothetical protein